MNKRTDLPMLLTIVTTAFFGILFFTHPAAGQESAAAPSAGKELYLPERASRVPDNNDYQDDESEFNFKRMVQADNVAIFWHEEYGDDPMTNPDPRKRFDVHHMLAECERFYDCYVNELKLVEKGQSISDRYKLLVYVFGGDSGTAFGGGVDEKVGVIWTPAVRVNRPPYGVLAHEMVHSFQYMIRVDTGKGFRGSMNEMEAQYMLWQVYPEWMTFENYHLVDFMKKTHYAFLHPTNMYHSPYVLEYWASLHGKEFFGNLCRASRPDEDPVMTYIRMNGLSQEQFNDVMFDAARRFITWDMQRIAQAAKPYINSHQSRLVAVDDGWYRVDPSRCPQNYGYNGIRLRVPAAGTRVTLEFKGIAGADGYSVVKVDQAGWRYGFLAYLNDGRRVYGDVYRDAEGTAAFEVPELTEALWLVVMGAPREHWPVAMRRRGGSEGNAEEQWPYQIKLAGTTPDESVIEQ